MARTAKKTAIGQRGKSKRTIEGRGRKTSTALARVLKAKALTRPESAIPTINETVENLERVRRFITRCLNTDLQHALTKLPQGKELDKKVRDRLEIDWGTIPGVDKPFLKQPGAEKFLFWLTLRPHFRTENFEIPGGHLEVVCSATVYHKKTREIVFEGPQCSCSTMETNYRFRWAKREPPAEPPTKEQAVQLKASGLGKWRKERPWVRGKQSGVDEWVWYDRVDNPNIHDERNKVRQMAQKRALVKAVRNMGALSEIFTSDPGEWDIPEEQGSPYEDLDHTPGGRRITVNGHRPSDAPGTAEAGGTKEASQAVADRKIAEHKAQEAERGNGVPKAVIPQVVRTLTEAQWTAFMDEAHDHGWHKPEIQEFLERNGWTRGSEIPQHKLAWLMDVARLGEDGANELHESRQRA